MANTNVPNKPSTAVWWILGIIALALFFWLLAASTPPDITTMHVLSPRVAAA